MKFLLIALSILLLTNIINNKAEDHWLKPQDYRACEEGYKAEMINKTKGTWDFTEGTWGEPNSGDDCNKRWNSGIMWEGVGNGTAADADFDCCYVEYEELSHHTVKKCYLVLNTKNGRKMYKERALERFSHVKIKCASSYLKLGSFILIMALFF